MYYTYIIWSPKSNNFYYGYTENLKKRIEEHNQGKTFATLPYKPWELVFYAAFRTEKLAKNFEIYLKTGSGKAFAYKRFLNSEALKKDKFTGTKGIPKPSIAES